MCKNVLRLYKEKTEVMAFGNKDVLKVNAYLDSRVKQLQIESKILFLVVMSNQ